MEKYIFDGRVDFETSPRYLKRNQPIQIKHNSFHQTSRNFLNNKVFITFDYSYYNNILPKTAQMRKQNRVYNLENILGWEGLEKSKKRNTEASEQNLFRQQKAKWKKGQPYIRDEGRRKHPLDTRSKKRKIKTPDKCYPSVGDYNIQTEPTKKRIIYDIKIRGKRNSCSGSQHRVIKLKNPKNLRKGSKRTENSFTGGGKRYNQRDYTMQNKLRKLEEDNEKLMDCIEVKNVWNRLMRKHKLKGTQFDTYPTME